MKRDLELIRHILLLRENSDEHDMTVADFVTEQYDFGAVSYHIKLLLDCCYIEAIDISSLGNPYSNYFVLRLTSFGHDYLDTIRNDQIWANTKSKFGDLLSSATFEMIKKVAEVFILKQLGI